MFHNHHRQTYKELKEYIKAEEFEAFIQFVLFREEIYHIVFSVFDILLQ